MTPNPSIDRTLTIPPLVRGGLVRAHTVSAEAGGKGINVSRVLSIHGHGSIAIAPLSPASGSVFLSLLGGATTLDTMPIHGDIRLNISLVEEDGTVTKVNEPGPTLEPHEVEELVKRTLEHATSAKWVVGSGSLPPGVAADFYRRLARNLPDGVLMAVDADGEALRACLGEPVALLKPNHPEVEALVGRILSTLGDVIQAAAEVVEAGAACVLVSLGADGAVAVDASGAIHAEARIDDVSNTVGAGDALLAGFLAAGGRRDGLKSAVAWSVAACRSPGTRVRPVERRDVDAVVVHSQAAVTRQLAA